MDSLTQIVLGAAVGEAVAGKKLGNKAMLWGAIAGTIPDLDILANPWLDTVEQLAFHRSITHSFLFAIVVSPLLGWLLFKFYKSNGATYRQWTTLFFLGFVTHILLDSCTTWGTQLFWPFSTYGVAFYNIFVIDPLYTLPFLGFTVAAAFYKRDSPSRKKINTLGLVISTLYLAFSFGFKAQANAVFEKELKENNITTSDYISKPTPLNTVLWSATAKSDKGFYTGFYSILDKDKQVNFKYTPQQSNLLEPYKDNDKLNRLIEITKGYYAIEEAPDTGILINDLRFGEFDGWREGGGQYVFVYHVWKNNSGELQFEEINNRPKIDRLWLHSYWERVTGTN